MRYGMPYKGSKNAIAEKIISALPPAEHFYDLFGGGGAITHCAVLSGKYKYVHYNELDPLTFKGFKMAINGEFKNENRWISREDFIKLKDTDPYVAICFSFGNDLKTYAYGKDVEPFKKAVHYSIFFNDDSLLKEYTDLSNFNYSSENSKERRLELQRYLSILLRENKLKRKIYANFNDGRNVVQSLESLQRLERLKSLENLKSLERLQNLDYSEVQIEDGGVIYCDIPYKSTNKYRTSFEHDRFYKWAEQQDNIFISEYEMPDNFIELLSVKKHINISANGKSHGKDEKLFTNHKTFELLNCNNNVLW